MYRAFPTLFEQGWFRMGIHMYARTVGNLSTYLSLGGLVYILYCKGLWSAIRAQQEDIRAIFT